MARILSQSNRYNQLKITNLLEAKDDSWGMMVSLGNDEASTPLFLFYPVKKRV